METKNCNTSSLEVYPVPLTKKNIQHLYRRIGFGLNGKNIKILENKNINEIVDGIINEAINKPSLERPIWFDWDDTRYPKNGQQRSDLIDSQYEGFKFDYINFLKDGNLKGRLSFFWSNHFVTERTKHFCNSYQYEYIECLNRNAIGNFKEFTKEIGLTNAMLIYLDGAFSRKENPNENYARELYELFTLGEGNGYTENDIIETSKALTGYFIEGVKHVKCSPINFNANNFNTSEKTIFGRKGNWDYFDVIDILFEEKKLLIAPYICRKFYEFFVHPDATNENAKNIIDQLSKTFLDNNFEIAPVLSQLFKSQHFFDDSCTGVVLKSPYDLLLNTINETEIPLNDRSFAIIQEGTRASGQRIFNPPDVAGWQRNRNWINSNFIINRWLSSESLLKFAFFQDNNIFKKYALDVVGDIGTTTNNPDLISRAIIDDFLPKGLLTESDYEIAYGVFRSDVSETYYEGGSTPSWRLLDWPTAPKQVYLLLLFLSREPEFQLK